MTTSMRPGSMALPRQTTGRQLARAVLPLLSARHIQTAPLRSPARLAGFSTSAAARSREAISVQDGSSSSNSSSSSSSKLLSATPPREVFPVQTTKNIVSTPPVWSHHGISFEEMLAVKPEHRAPTTFGDRFAWGLMRMCRWGMDTATGMQQTAKPVPDYIPAVPPPVGQEAAATAATAPAKITPKSGEKPLTEAQWMMRFIFLESIAGVPGMVAGMLRHLHSLRRLRRDNGWIETLLEESYNERMHLMTFMKMCSPGWFMKLMILGAQGVYFNTMFFCYLLSPAMCHRFVGYLEEEAVHTYTQCLAEIDAGHVPQWTDPSFELPEIAIKYWKMPPEHRTMRDLILYVRADEATHRGVNHTLSNLDQKLDPNPFVSEYKPGHKQPDPLKAPAGFEREEVL